MEPLQNVSHTEQVPFQGNFLQSTQRELLKTRNPLNNPNDWFDKTSAPSRTGVVALRSKWAAGKAVRAALALTKEHI